MDDARAVLSAELGWSWAEERGRHLAWAVMLRLERQFEGDVAAVN